MPNELDVKETNGQLLEAAVHKGFKDKHLKVTNEYGVVSVIAERVTKLKDGSKLFRSFVYEVYDPTLKDKKVQHELKDGVLTVNVV